MTDNDHSAWEGSISLSLGLAEAPPTGNHPGKEVHIGAYGSSFSELTVVCVSTIVWRNHKI